MRLPRIAIENSAFTWMLVIFLAVIGIRALLTMPRTENPEVTVPGSSIVVVMPGASTLDMEQLVALPVEEALNGLEDIKKITTDVRDGITITAVEFEFSSDPDKKFDEVTQQINTIRNSLPEEIVQLDMWQWSIADMNMMQLALVSDEAPFSEMEDLADDLKKNIEKIPSIRKVAYYGLPEQEVHINLDFEKMALTNTTMDHVIQAVESNNMNIPGGELKLGPTGLSVKSSGSFQNLDEIRNCVVNASMGHLVYLRDIAKVDFGYEDRDYITRFGSKAMNGKQGGGHRCIFIGINQKEGLNVLSAMKDLEPVLREFKSELPGEVSLEQVYSQPESVRNRINRFLNNLLQGMILVGVIIFVSLGFRSAVVVALAIPLSLVIGLGFIDLSGFGLQQISIAGLVVALGMLVDNSIVMVENINRFMQMGYGRREASIQAASEIGWPVVTATLTTILAFIPIAAMPEETGEFIKSLPITIMITLTVSLFIALTFTPVITSRMFREKDALRTRTRSAGRFMDWIIRHPFRSSIDFALKNPVVTLLIAVLYLGISSWMFRYVGISFFPKAEQPNLMIQAALPEGYNLDRTDQVASYIESVLDTMPEVRYYATNVGHGNPQIYYNVLPRRHDIRFAEVYAELYSYDSEAFAQTLRKLRDRFGHYPGARIRVKEFEQGPPFEAPVQIFITGDDLEELKRISADVEQMIRDQPGTINIENQFVKTNTELHLEINKDKANMLGVPVVEIDRAVRTAVAGMKISSFRDETGKQYHIVLKMDLPGDFSIDQFDKVYVSSLSGKQIPVRQFVGLNLKQVPSSISRFDLERTAEILADLRPGHSLDEVMEPVISQLEKYPMPMGYRYKVSGEVESRAESFGGMANAVLIAVISIFSVLVLQFRSIKQPLIIFIAVPFAFTGMVWALLITGNTFSFTAFVGLTSLVGIVVNNSIILVDYINILRKKGESLPVALRTAAETRLTPIILTAFTTIGGLLPLTLRGGTMWAPMGWTIIGGLLVSTILTLAVVPVTYFLFERKSEGKADPVSAPVEK